MRVLSLESRRAPEIERLIRAQGGDGFVAPSMREVPLSENPQALAFGEKLFRGHFDMMIFMTGVGARLLGEILGTSAFIEALRKLAVVARGSKPVAVMREWGVPVAVVVPEPNTWREVAAAIEGRAEKRIAVQEYGRSNDELAAALRARGAEVTAVPVYQWDLPQDRAPLQEAVRRLASGQVDVLLVTTSVQIAHLFRVAKEMGCELRLDRVMIASVGPSTSASLADYGLRADFEPSHPKMGFLVSEAASQAARIVEAKRREG